MKLLVEPFLPSEDSAYVNQPIPYRFFLSEGEEDFLRRYLDETLDPAGGYMQATHWLWSNDLYLSTLEGFLNVYRRPGDHFYHQDRSGHPSVFRAPWLAREDFEARLEKALEEFPALKQDSSFLPGYRPEGYEEIRQAWLRSIPKPPAMTAFADPTGSSTRCD